MDNDSPVWIAAGEAASRGYRAPKEANFAMAREYYLEAAKLYLEESRVLAYAHPIRHIADIYRQEHNPVTAKSLYEEALEIYRGNLDTKLLDLANTVRPCALIVEEQGNAPLALKLWEEARTVYGSLRIEQGVSECDHYIKHLQPS
jgi:tetratricopeptide (TPR) repeat protein